MTSGAPALSKPECYVARERARRLQGRDPGAHRDGTPAVDGIQPEINVDLVRGYVEAEGGVELQVEGDVVVVLLLKIDEEAALKMSLSIWLNEGNRVGQVCRQKLEKGTVGDCMRTAHKQTQQQ